MKNKLALVFPGQGSQYVGMGSQFKKHNFFKEADSFFDFSLTKLCLEGPEEKLKLTEYTQPAIVLHSLILFDLLKKKLEDQPIDYVLGHSVGEYSALAAAGCLTLEQALKAVNLRGASMQEATPVGVGAMVAIMKIEANIIEQACQEISTESESVSIANHNSPAQVVISGHKTACLNVVEKLKADGHRMRSVELPVSAPFHSSLMQPAAVVMEKHLAETQLNPNQISYIANTNAEVYPIGTKPETIKKNLVDQVCGQVRWVDSINQLPSGTHLIEVGPGKVLTGLCRKIRDDISLFTLDSENALDDVLNFIKG